MGRDESLYPADWKRIAEKDLERVRILLAAHDPAAAGFYLQQVVEKLLKAFLLSKGWKLRRTHDLEYLLNAATAYDQDLEVYRAVCQKITGFYLVERYPLMIESALTESEVYAAWTEAAGLIERLRQVDA